MPKERWKTAIPPVAEARLVGCVAEQGKLQSASGAKICRIVIQVGGVDFILVARNDLGEHLAACNGGDEIEAKGKIILHNWSTGGGAKREAVTIEVTEFGVCQKRDRSLRQLI
jgi:hypothetical protein